MFPPERQPEYFKKSRLLPAEGDRIWIRTNESPRYELPIEGMWSGYGIKGPTTDRTDHYITYRVIGLITGGEHIHAQGGVKLRVTPGDAFFIDKGTAFRGRTGGAGFFHMRYVAFTGSMADALAESSGLWKQRLVRLESPGRLGKVKSLLKEINRLMGDPRNDRHLDVSTTIYRLIIEIGESLAARPYPAAVVKVLALLEKSIDRFVSTQEMAAVAALSRMQLTRLLSRHFNLPPLKYSVRLKMRHAMNLLLTTGLTVKEIAARVGYANPQMFSTRFRAVTGESPSEVRKRVSANRAP